MYGHMLCNRGDMHVYLYYKCIYVEMVPGKEPVLIVNQVLHALFSLQTYKAPMTRTSTTSAQRE